MPPAAVLPAPPHLRPPLKWAGGKRWLVPHLRHLWKGHERRRLVEPFCGGLAVALGLRPRRALLNDVNPHLIGFYRQLARGLVISLPMRNAPEAFYAYRQMFNALLAAGRGHTAEAASIFYYLNRTGFNGLCRFNSRGEFNVPFGRYARIAYVRDFSAYRQVFSRWEFSSVDFESLRLKTGDFVYADPSYDVPFTQYARRRFSWDDQVRAAEWLARHPGPQGGTIFLDDIDDVPMSMQVKLLRVLQNPTIERLGGTRSINVDVRVITGSKRDLRQMVGEGKFREDLFYRLNVIPVVLPPLRERREDVPVLAEHFIKRFFRQRGEDARQVSPAVLQAFMRYPWPGNVRELENACERIAQSCTCETVRIGCVPATVLFHKYSVEHEPIVETHVHPSSISLDERLKEVETNLISWALKVSGGNKSKAAELLQIKRSTLGDRIKKLDLDHLATEATD